MSTAKTLPVVIIGAGPVGLAAAANLIEKGEQPIILEAGNSVAASVLAWGHVKLFSPWKYCTDGASIRLLEKSGWIAPDPETWPTGLELAQKYLLPLAATPELSPTIRTGSKVVAVARYGLDKMKNDGRNTAPFILTLEHEDGSEETIFARAVIDASGTYLKPNPLGASGIYATGEKAAQSKILYRIPDVHGADRGRYAGKRIAVVGSGHSAFNALIELAELAREVPETQITWIVRKTDLTQVYGGETGDALPERGALGRNVRGLVASGRVKVEPGFQIVSIESGCCGGSDCCGTQLVSEDGRRVAVDEVIATTGFRPDLSILSELRLDLHPAVESPTILADMIDPNFHSCGTVDPHGAVELSHPEKDFYIVGMKSYGRAPTFLMLTGYEQVRSIACELTGDHEGARKLELVLPETGVCSGDGCCSPPPNRQTIPARKPLGALKMAVAAPCCDSDTGCC